MRFYLTLFTLLVVFAMTMTMPAKSQIRRPCDGHRPYYHEIDTGPGSLIADLFFFPGTLTVGVAAAPFAGAKALCVPLSHGVRLVKAKHKRANNANPQGY